MGRAESLDEELVSAAARSMLERVITVEPEQASARRTFSQQAQDFFTDPARALSGKSRRGGPLEFGLTGVEPLLTPVLLEAAAQVMAYLGTVVLLRGVTWSAHGVRQLFGGHDDGGDQNAAEADPDLTAAQWARVRQLVEEVLVRHGRIGPDRAELLAAAVVGEALLSDTPL